MHTNLLIIPPSLIHKFKVLPDTKKAFGNGLLGMTIDPDFAANKFVYLFLFTGFIAYANTPEYFKV